MNGGLFPTTDTPDTAHIHHSPLMGPIPPLTGTTTPNPEATAAGEIRRFHFPLPFDPIRLLGGVLSRWPWIAIGTLLLGTIGVVVGTRITHPTFSVTASLIKRRVPQTVQTSETGQAYRPVDLNDATLHATLLASEPLDLTLKRIKNGIAAENLASFVEAEQLEGTDIFRITYHSPISPEDAVAFTSTWATEINGYTQRLQQTEAREVRLILQKEVAELEKQINETDLEILRFSREKDYLGGNSQVSAALAKLGQIELQQESARTSAAAAQEQIANLTAQIRRQSPIEQQLKTAREELANLRATYTDANPLVQAKLQSLEYLASQVAKEGGKDSDDLESYTGTPLGNQIYLSIIELKNKLSEANSQIESLGELHKATAKRIAEFPAIVTVYESLVKKRDTLTEGLSLMSNRLREAEIFASGAPGYWQVFQAPDPREIIPSSLIKKPAILGALAGMTGACTVIFLTLLLTHRTSRRSILECCSATGSPLVSRIQLNVEDEARDAVTRLWLTRLSIQSDLKEPALLWTAALSPDDERKLWTILAEALRADTGKIIRVLDLTPSSLWDEVSPPASLEWIKEPSATSAPLAAYFLRASSLPPEPTRTHLQHVKSWFQVVSGEKSHLRRASEFRAVVGAYLPSCSGTIGCTMRPPGAIRQAADQLSLFIAQRFS